MKLLLNLLLSSVVAVVAAAAFKAPIRKAIPPTLLPTTPSSHEKTTTATTPTVASLSSSSSSNSATITTTEETLDRVIKVVQDSTLKNDVDFERTVKYNFPNAITNQDLAMRVVSVLASQKGYTSSNTLLSTSLSADELARNLEEIFVAIYGSSYTLGGLAGFPFAGITGFTNMISHVPTNGYALVIHAPNVGISRAGAIGKVERDGMTEPIVDSCCYSSIMASNYVKDITEGGAKPTTASSMNSFLDYQQTTIQQLILPHGHRLAKSENRMLELPYAMYDSQSIMMNEIITACQDSIPKHCNGFAVLGGIQINTGPTTLDYFHPLRLSFYNNQGKMMEDLLPLIAKEVADDSTTTSLPVSPSFSAERSPTPPTKPREEMTPPFTAEM